VAELLGRFSAFIEYASLYVRDPASRATHLEWDPTASRFDIATDSLVMAVQASVDGPVNVSIWSGAPESRDYRVRLLQTRIKTPSQKLEIHDAANDVIMKVYTDPMTALEILVDDPRFAEHVDICLQGPETIRAG
jgi:hypothetical protein